MKTDLVLIAAALIYSLPCAAQPHPFGGEVLDLTTEAAPVRSAPTLEERQGAARRFLKTLYRDPYIKAIGPRVNLGERLQRLAEGQPFDVESFRAAGKDAIANPSIRTADVGARELQQKLDMLESVLSSPSRPGAPTRGPPLGEVGLSSGDLVDIIGSKHTRVMSLERVPGARVTHLSDLVELPTGGTREATALDLYGRLLVRENNEGRGDLRAGLAHREVGRAVLGPSVRHPLGATTEDVLKGVGATPFAGNRFSSKATGTFPLPEAVRDWERTETLRRAGVAVYEPVTIVQLPYAEWSMSEGWRPIAVYVRRPRENLRVSDLEYLDANQKRLLIDRIKAKIENELKGVGRPHTIEDVDVIRYFAERMGRTAGIFQGGISYSGRGPYFFHGMLHDQNVSLLGEIVDVGNSVGLLRNSLEMLLAWKSSIYTSWPYTLVEFADFKGKSETAILKRLVRVYNERLASVTGGGITEAELHRVFRRGYHEGLSGTSASDPRISLRIERDAFAEYRRKDGTLRWGDMTRDRVLHEGAGLGHFALALFLKEIAVVAATGDRVRIEEFFDGLLTTDFYKHYGLFVAGARVGEVAYTRYLQRYIKPRFVNGILKTNLVLATGIALPLIVEGKLEGKAFAISVASLGLSSTAVKAGVAGIKWVMNLKKARAAGFLSGVSAGAGRLAKLSGWFYSAAELAVVLYLGEEIDARVNAFLDLRSARAELARAGRTFLEASSGVATPETIGEAADAYHSAWIDYRNFLYHPLYTEEARLTERLKASARRAKLMADKRSAVVKRVKRSPALLASIIRRHGSCEAFADSLVQRDEAALKHEVNRYVESYTKNRDAHLREVYEGNLRATPLLAQVEHLNWLVAGGQEGAPGDPYGERSDMFARYGRSRLSGALDEALSNVSKNRLEAYGDELEVLGAVITSLQRRGRRDLAEVIEARLDGVHDLKRADQNLSQGDGLIDDRERWGLTDRVGREP